MKKIVLLLCYFILISCEAKEEFIYYSYKKVTITRLNKENEIYFYYGEYKEIDKLPDTYIKVSSFDGYMQGFLIFRESGQVEIIKTEGKFEEVNTDRNNFKLVVFDHNVSYINWQEKIVGNYKNIAEFLTYQNIEIERNRKNNSEVEVMYQN